MLFRSLALLAGCGPSETTRYNSPEGLVEAAKKAGYICGDSPRRNAEAGAREFIVCRGGGKFSVYQNLNRQAADRLTFLMGKTYTIMEGSNWLASFPKEHDPDVMLKYMGGRLVEN